MALVFPVKMQERDPGLPADLPPKIRAFPTLRFPPLRSRVIHSGFYRFPPLPSQAVDRFRILLGALRDERGGVNAHAP